jgi:cell wall-associated NlpC family hydrolase
VSVQKQLGALAVRNTALNEQFDQARILVTHREQAARAAQAVAGDAAATFHQGHSAFVQVIQAQYEAGGSFGSAGALLTSTSRGSYLDQSQLQSLMSKHMAEVVSEYDQDRATAATAVRQASAALRAARKEQASLATRRATLTTQISKYQRLLATLTSAQRVDYQRARTPALTVAAVSHMHLTKASSAAAAQAVRFALAQVGKWYQSDAAGPSTYDCSGLTMRAWGSAGVSLPHSAAGQYSYGHHVRADVADLQPGDLIFFYTPIGHVTIYIGNGLMVSAPETGEKVSVIPIDGTNAPIVGATRLT